MTSQKDIINFIRVNYGNNMDLALSVLKRHIPSGKLRGGQPNDEKIEDRLYSTVYLLSWVKHKTSEDGILLKRYTNPTNPEDIMEELKSICKGINDFIEIKYPKPNKTKYNSWLKKTNLKTIPFKERKAIDLASALKDRFILGSLIPIPDGYLINKSLKSNGFNQINPDGILEALYWKVKYHNFEINPINLTTFMNQIFKLKDSKGNSIELSLIAARDLYRAFLYAQHP